MFVLKFYVERRGADQFGGMDRMKGQEFSHWEVLHAPSYTVTPDPENREPGCHRYRVWIPSAGNPMVGEERIVGVGLDEYQRMIAENMHGKTTEIISG